MKPLTRTAFVFVLLMLVARCSPTDQPVEESCTVCERIHQFESLKRDLAKRYWPPFLQDSLSSPLVYFTDSVSFLAFSDALPFENVSYKRINCSNGETLLMMTPRLDTIPFHMENKMTFSDSLSPNYYSPIMFCSDAETAKALIPEVQHTEEWMQLVMHEYFHAFQFRHRKSIDHLANQVTVQTDSLHAIYRKYPWFRKYLEIENHALLKAIHTNETDSLHLYQKRFFDARNARRKMFKDRFGFDIVRHEKFWEKLEGTARYMEYNAGFIYSSAEVHGNSCDSLFNNYNDYSLNDFLGRPWFVEKTKMMTAYYYVTGFNLCRLLDRYQIQYKNELFDQPLVGLEDFLPE